MKDANSLDYYIEAVHQQDTHKRLKIVDDLIKYLTDSSNPLDSGADRLIDGLTAWAGSSNFRISQYGLEILGIVAERVGSHFRGHLNSVVPVVVDRLGDTKSQVRDRAQALLLITMGPVSSPQNIFDILVNCFGHKNWRVRDELMVCLMKTIKRFGASSLQISKLMPSLCKLLGDPTSQVRETAINTIVEVYRHVGEKVRNDIAKRGLPAARLNTLNAKFDECLRNDDMVAPPSAGSSLTNNRGVNSGVKVNGEADIHNAKPARSKSVRRTQSFNAPKKSSSMERVASAAAGGTGAVDETDFISAWDEVPELRIHSNKDLVDELGKLNECLSNANNDWEKRVQALKQVRSVAKQFGDNDQLQKLLRDLEGSFKTSAKDLRSSVTREVCITLSYLANLLGNQFDYLAEAIVPSLINLIPNSAKIMSSSGHCAIRLIIKHTCVPRLIPVFVSNLLTNKSKDIRRKVAEYIDLLLEMWETSVIKGHVALLEEAIRKGVGDADSEARAAMRRAFWHFAEHYKERAESLMHTLDASKQKLLQSDKNLLQAGVSRPSSSFGGRPPTKSSSKMRSSSSSNNQENEREMMPPPAWRPNNNRGDRGGLSNRHLGMQRSASHLEGKSSSSPAMEPRQKSCDDFGRGSATRQGRPRMPKRPAASQPASRSGSPSRYGNHLLMRERSEDYMTLRSPLKTKIPTPSKPTSRSTSRTGSRAASRDVSPSRMRTMSGSSVNYAERGQGRYLSEDALWNAYERSPARRRFDSQGSRNNDYSSDEESDASSVCSERSYSSQNLRKAQISQDTREIIALLNSQSWSERRDGLAALQVYLQGQKRLSLEETLRVKDSFNKFFADPHNKVYSLFLDVLSEFIVLFKTDLQDWLFVILTRLLQKLGTEMLPSLNSKVARVLDVVRDSFPYDHQFQILTKYVTDNTQTPNLRMKVAILQYLQGLISLMDPSDFVNTAAIRLAVSRIIAWTSEPKSAEVRKEATAVIVTLFELNTPEFSMMLSQLPNSFQDGATRLLHNHLKPMALRQNQSVGSPEADDLDGEDFSSNFTYPRKKEAKARLGYRSISPTKLQSGGSEPRSPQGDSMGRPGSHSPTRPAIGIGAEAGDTPGGGSRIPVRTRLNFSPTDSDGYNSPMGTPSKTSGSHQSRTHGMAGSPPDFNNTTVFSLSRVSPPNYDPKHYEDRGGKVGNGTVVNGNDSTFLSPEMLRVADGAEEPDKAPEGSSLGDIGILSQIITVLSAPSQESSSDDVKDALLELIKMLRGEPKDVADDMSTLISALIGVSSHQVAVVRCLSIRALREIIRSYPRTSEGVMSELIRVLLEAQGDAQKEVVKTAEECCSLVAGSFSHSKTIKTLAPMIESSPFPVNMAAIKLLNTVVESCSVDVVVQALPDIMPHLLKSYEHEQSSVRKASVLCLVAVHNAVGENACAPYLRELQGPKIKLLNLYIRRSQAS